MENIDLTREQIIKLTSAQARAPAERPSCPLSSSRRYCAALDNLFPADQHPNLLVGLGAPDDAAVYRLNDEQALIQTVDFFTPIVDTPYEYGAIAAANALSDVYAMGGEVLRAEHRRRPPDLPTDLLAEILRGGAEVVRSWARPSWRAHDPG